MDAPAEARRRRATGCEKHEGSTRRVYSASHCAEEGACANSVGPIAQHVEKQRLLETSKAVPRGVPPPRRDCRRNACLRLLSPSRRLRRALSRLASKQQKLSLASLQCRCPHRDGQRHGGAAHRSESIHASEATRCAVRGFAENQFDFTVRCRNCAGMSQGAAEARRCGTADGQGHAECGGEDAPRHGTSRRPQGKKTRSEGPEEEDVDFEKSISMDGCNSE